MKRLSFLALILVAFGCSSTNYSYKFKGNSENYKPALAVNEAHQSVEVIAEGSNLNNSFSTEFVDSKESPLYKVDDLSTDIAENYSPSPVLMKSKKELKKETKESLKELKKDLKEYKKENKKSVKQVSGNTRTGIIIGVAGLVLMILGTGTVSSIGGLLLLIGVIFILVDLL